MHVKPWTNFKNKLPKIKLAKFSGVGQAKEVIDHNYKEYTAQIVPYLFLLGNHNGLSSIGNQPINHLTDLQPPCNILFIHISYSYLFIYTWPP